MSSDNVIIEPMTESHWNDLRRIYLEGIETKNATFETEVPSWEIWDKTHRIDCRFISGINGKVVGWAALSNVSVRFVYRGVAEVSIYIDAGYRGKGIGDALLRKLIKESESNNIWTLQAGIFPENKASIYLHEKHGFRILGVREKVGKMGDWWRYVVLMERRSTALNN
jgi:L-amino acid N-acyltransferase YncA